MGAKPQEKDNSPAPPQDPGPVRASVVLLSQGKLPDVMSEYVSHVTKQNSSGAVEVQTGERAIQVLRASGGGLLVFAVTDRTGLSEVLRALVGLDADIRKGIVRCLGLNATPLAEANRVLLKKGCSEVLEKTVSIRALMHKADRWRKFVEQKLMERRRIAALPAEKREASKTPLSAVAAAQAQVSPEARLVAALEGEFDIWLTRSKVPAKRVMGKWFMELVGPGPSISRWVSRGPHKDEGSIEQEWYYEVSEEGELKPKGGAWVFRGRKPEFKWSSNRWLFVSAKPTLVFRAEDGKETSRVKPGDAGGLEIASNSKRAEGLEARIKESVEAAEVFKNDRVEQGNKKVDGAEAEEREGKGVAQDGEAERKWNDKRTADERSEAWGDKRTGDEEDRGWSDKRTADEEDARGGTPKANGDKPDEEDTDPAAVSARARGEITGKRGKDGASKDATARAGAKGADDSKVSDGAEVSDDSEVSDDQSSASGARPDGKTGRGGKTQGKLRSIAGGKASEKSGRQSEGADSDSPFNDRQSEGKLKTSGLNDKLGGTDESHDEGEQEGGWDPFSEMRKKKARQAAARAQAEGKDEEVSRASKDGKSRAPNGRQGKSKDSAAAPFNDKQGDGKSAASPFNDKQDEGESESSPFNDRQSEGEERDPTQLNDRRSGKNAAAKWNKHGLTADETRGWGNLLEDLGPYVYVQLEPKDDGIKGRLSDICEFEVTFEIANTDLTGRKTLDFRIEAFHEGFKIEIRDQVEVLACDPIEEGFISVTVRVPEKHVRSLDRLRELVALRQESVQNFMLAARGT